MIPQGFSLPRLPAVRLLPCHSPGLSPPFQLNTHRSSGQGFPGTFADGPACRTELESWLGVQGPHSGPGDLLRLLPPMAPHIPSSPATQKLETDPNVPAVPTPELLLGQGPGGESAASRSTTRGLRVPVCEARTPEVLERQQPSCPLCLDAPPFLGTPACLLLVLQMRVKCHFLQEAFPTAPVEPHASFPVASAGPGRALLSPCPSTALRSHSISTSIRRDSSVACRPGARLGCSPGPADPWETTRPAGSRKPQPWLRP